VNPLEQYPGVRKALYTVQWIVNGVLGILGVVYTARGDSPAWLVLVAAVFNFVWAYTGLTASANVPESPTPAPPQ
jgi:hypothetical protein